MLQAMFGWVGSHTTGLFADETEFIDDADSSGERSIEDKYARQSGETQAGALHVQHADSQLDAKHLEQSIYFLRGFGSKRSFNESSHAICFLLL